MAVPADFLQRRISGKSTKKTSKKSPVQFTGNAFYLITGIMLNKGGILGMVIFEGGRIDINDCSYKAVSLANNRLYYKRTIPCNPIHSKTYWSIIYQVGTVLIVTLISFPFLNTVRSAR